MNKLVLKPIRFQTALGIVLALINLGLPYCPCSSAESSEAATEPFTVVIQNTNSASAPEKTSEQPTHLLKGQVTYVVPKGTNIPLKLSNIPTTGLRLLDRDLDGRLYPARLDQEITAKTTEDLYVDSDKVIPEGTIFHGRITEVIPPKRANRPGALRFSFDQLTTPDGKKFAFYAEADDISPSTAKTKAKGLGRVAAYAAGGSIVGAMVAYQIFGMDKTIAMHGYNIAGGAALGAAAAITYSLMKHGSPAVLEPGEDLNMQIDTDLLLPAAKEPTAKAPLPHLPGLEVTVQKSKLVKDGLDSYMLNVEALIVNNTDVRLNSIDLYIEDDNKNRYPLIGDESFDSELIFEVDPRSMKKVSCSFQVEYPKLKRTLIWLDHESHKILIAERVP